MENMQACGDTADGTYGPMMQRLGRTWTIAGDLAAAAYWAIARGGLALPTQRALAEESYLSTSAISRNCAGGLVEILTGGTSQARSLSYPPGREGLHRWIPDTDGAVLDARVWLAWLELARSHADVAAGLDEANRLERETLARDVRSAGLADDPVVLTAVEALVVGLVTRRCDPAEPIGHGEAVQALDRVTDALRAAAAAA